MTTKPETETATADNGSGSETETVTGTEKNDGGSETDTGGDTGSEPTEEGKLRKLRSDLDARDDRIGELSAKLEAYEAEKLTDAEKREKALEQSNAENVKLRRDLVAARHGLDEELADRLRGETLEELEADAAKLAEKFVPPEVPKPPKAKDAGVGVPGGDGAELDPIAAHRKFTGRS